jgi:hypothetical protein
MRYLDPPDDDEFEDVQPVDVEPDEPADLPCECEECGPWRGK